jgi:site-specific DNA-methyltransferase (cytosine-N4-specific)
VFSRIDAPIVLCLTSPPYPLAKARNYGNVDAEHYVDWFCRTVEPVIKNLVPGGSLAINLSNDIFVPGLPARSLYREKLVIALCERFGLYKIDEIPGSTVPNRRHLWLGRPRNVSCSILRGADLLVLQFAPAAAFGQPADTS